MRLILIGGPGSGKGTLAKQIQSKLGYKHFSTGELLREHIQNQTKLGMLAKPLLDRGLFVPDEIIVEMVKEKITNMQNFVLDGFPRTINQAKAISKFAEIDKVIYLHCDFKTLLNRLSKRRMCENNLCGAIYNLNSYKKPVCSKCGSKLYQRDDDKKQVILKRFKVYKNLTHPLVKFYKKQNKLIKLNAKQSPEQIFDNFQEMIKKGT